MKIVLTTFLCCFLCSCVLGQGKDLFIYFDESDSKQHKRKYSEGIYVYTYTIDRNPYSVDFREARKAVQMEVPKAAKIKSYEWLNEHYGWKDNIAFLEGTIEFNRKYQDIYLVLLPSKKVVKVFDFTLRSH